MFTRLPTLILLLLIAVTPLRAQDRDVPYWASIRASVLNMRVGPSVNYKIDWVYRRPGLPVKIVRVMEGWRLIEDPDGARGWVVARLLTDEVTAIVIGKNESAIYVEPDKSSKIKWRVEPGVIGTLGDCEDGWCEFSVGKRGGYVPQDRLWGGGKLR